MRELIRIGNVVYDVSGFNSREMEMLRRAPEAFPTRRVQPQLVSGTYTKAIREAADGVENASNEFFQEMGVLYPSFRVISTSAAALPDGVRLYIVYSV